MLEGFQLCKCGCGQKTPLATRTRNGNIKGQPTQYIPSHRALPNPTPNFVIEDRGFQTPCWIWKGSIDRKGYGRHNGGRTSKVARAHWRFYEAYVGPVPKGLMLDHLCRQHPCVNPSHLEPVTNFENCIRGNATKLNWSDVREIRASNLSLNQLARKYNVSKGNINFIRQGKTWKEEMC